MTRTPIARALSLCLLLLSRAALAHIEYYDLNQGIQVLDLTAAGKTASTTQYGSTPADVLALNGPPRADGISGVGISAQQDLALDDTGLWTPANQTTRATGIFSGMAYTPDSSTAIVDVADATDNAWGDGTRSQLGDSHRVDFFNLRLSKTSLVTITWNIDTSGTFLDSGFTLYRGVLAYQAHDDAPGAEILNPVKIGVGKVQDALDDGTHHDVQGILSPFRGTGPGAADYFGQFNSLGNWSMANPAGNWSAIEFIRAVNEKTMQLSATASDTLETLTITLPAGNYTIAASGALGIPGSGASFGFSNLHGRLTYSAAAVDTAPDPFTFTDVTGVSPGTLTTSHAITVSGIDSSAPIAVSGDPSSEYSISGGTFTSAAGTVADGDTVVVRHQSSAGFGTSVNTVLDIGGVTDTFTSTTVQGAGDAVPDPFAFTVVWDVDPATPQVSNAITVTGIDVQAPVSVVGGEYSVNGGTYTSASGLVSNNDAVTVRHTSASGWSSATNTTLTIGGLSDVFTSITRAEPSSGGVRRIGTSALDGSTLATLTLVAMLRALRTRKISR